MMIAKKQIVLIEDEKSKSKGTLLRNIEKMDYISEESRTQMITSLEKSMKRDDWIDYSVLLKIEGISPPDIAKRINFSVSWLKKWVNPIFKKVTREELASVDDEKMVTNFEAIDDSLPQLERTNLFEFDIVSLNKSSRAFQGWGSVEVIDSHNEIITIKALETIMPTYMARGGPIMFSHSNRHVGKVHKWSVRDKLVKGINVKGLWLEGQIFNNYKIDDKAWECIQLAASLGIPVLSLGATPIGKPERECDENSCVNKYDHLQLYEFTVTNVQGHSLGANPEALVELALIKSQMKELDALKNEELIGSYMLKEKTRGFLPTSEDELVNFMLSKCDSCQDEFKSLLDDGHTEIQAKAKLYEELKKSLETIEQETDLLKESVDMSPTNDDNTDLGKAAIWSAEINSLNTEIKTLQDKMSRAEKRMKNLKNKLSSAQKKRKAAESERSIAPKSADNANLDDLDVENMEKETIEKIAKLEKGFEKMEGILGSIEKKLNKQEDEKKPPKEKDPKEKTPPTDEVVVKPPKPEGDEDKDKKKDEATGEIKLSDEQFAKLAKEKGFVSAGSTAPPTITTGRGVTKGEGKEDPNKMPPLEERLAAMKKGELLPLLHK